MIRETLAFLSGRDEPHRGRAAAGIRAFDAAVERRLAPHRSPGLDRVFYPLSSAADHGLLWLAIAAVRAAAVPRHRRSLVRVAAAIGLESAITNGVLKTPFRRVRPPLPVADGPLPYGLHRPLTSAFPSGHAASAFAAATVLADDDPLAPVYYALAAMVGASRVYVRMHHASDVIAGAAWGRVFGLLARARIRASRG